MFERFWRASSTIANGPGRLTRSPQVVRVGISFDRTPDPAWQAALDAFCPPSDLSSRLVLVWDPGDRWQRIDRWTILQVQPWAFVGPELRAVLAGPHVRTRAVRTPVQAVVDGKLQTRTRLRGPYINPWVDRLCYETHHALRSRGILGLPKRFWVIQGQGGGHPHQLSAAEEQLWQQQGLAHPAAGQLPYAPFDQRVTDAITRYDLWQYAHQISDPQSFAVKATIARLHANEVDAHTLMWQQWHDQTDAMFGELRTLARQAGLHRTRWTPVGEKAPHIDVDNARDTFLHTHSIEAAG